MEQFLGRINNIINTCWDSFSAKVGGGLIDINKEASMQLNFAYLLKNTIDLAIHHEDETIKIELETGIAVNGQLREADIVIEITKGEIIRCLPIELKCYKEQSSSGGKRGAQDLFRYDVYDDIQLLENYSNIPNYIQGIQLTMTDYRVFGFPNRTTGKSWDYNTAHGTQITNGVTITTPMANRASSIILTKSYLFNWREINGFYFLMLRGS